MKYLNPKSNEHQWSNGMIIAFQAVDPGSTPGWCIFLVSGIYRHWKLQTPKISFFRERVRIKKFILIIQFQFQNSTPISQKS